MEGWINARICDLLCSPSWLQEVLMPERWQAGERSNKFPHDFDMELNSAQSIFFPLSIYSGQSVPYQMSSRLVGNMRILFENIIFFQFCFAAQTFVCFAVCCTSDRIQTNCFGFLNCFVFSIQLSFISFPFLHLALTLKFQFNPQWESTILLLLSFRLRKGTETRRSEFSPHLSLTSSVTFQESPFLSWCASPLQNKVCSWLPQNLRAIAWNSRGTRPQSPLCHFPHSVQLGKTSRHFWLWFEAMVWGLLAESSPSLSTPLPEPPSRRAASGLQSEHCTQPGLPKGPMFGFALLSPSWEPL